jgi:anti-sigma regulatory factor (Ser/Thr protein kinase)
VEVTTIPGPPLALTIADPSRPGEARRRAVAMAGILGFDETERGKVAIIVTEAATNLLKHAGGGELIVSGLERGPRGGLELLALDRGPGMHDVGRCLSDGYSTAGSAGTGLGAMVRLSTLVEIQSAADQGTALLVRLWASPPPDPDGEEWLELGVVNLPMAGEAASGDAWAIVELGRRNVLVVADGLGHGPMASEAALAAVRIARERAADGPAEVIRAAHAALRSTRGAALAVAELDRDRGQVRYAGVGNISGTILTPDRDRASSLVSHNGIVGHEMRKVQEFEYPWSPGSTLVMHSDGLATHWRLDRYPGLLARHPSLIAGVLYRDFARGRDDVTVLVARDGRGQAP